MSFNKYYQDELSFLREMGKEFSRAYPATAPLLADRGNDPDVERLLEGFAFLTGRIRQKLDDEFPELTHALMSLLWPHYLRPIPSISLLEFLPIKGAVRGHQRIPRGTEVDSIPVEGTPCRFRTCSEVDLYPFAIVEAGIVVLPDGRSSLRLQFKMSPGASLDQIQLEDLRLHFLGEPAYLLYLWCCRNVAEVRLRGVVNGVRKQGVTIPSTTIRPGGFSREEALLPYPKASFDGYRLLQEYFSFPEKFLFVDLTGLSPLKRTPVGHAFEVELVFATDPPPSLKVTCENVRLYTTPIVNLLKIDSDPIRVNHERVEYRIRPEGPSPLHYEIYSIDRAVGWVRGSAEEREYEPFYAFKHALDPSGEQKIYYQTRLRNAVSGDGSETYVSFVDNKQASLVPPTETVVFGLTCTNRNLAGKLRIGDIQTATGSSPEYARFRNITHVSPTVCLSLEGDLYWRLISHLSLNYISLSNVDALQGILRLYNFQAHHDRPGGRANERRLSGIKDIQSKGETLLFHGAPIRGTVTNLALIEDHFSGEGDMYLFASILNEFMALYASLNSFSQLLVKEVKQGEIYQWPPRTGQQIVL